MKKEFSNEELDSNRGYVHAPEFDNPSFEPVRPIEVREIRGNRSRLEFPRSRFRLVNEKNAFLKYNYDRMRLLGGCDSYAGIVSEDEGIIVEGNLGLVYAVMNAYPRLSDEFRNEFFTEGLNLLLTYTRRFDVSLGNKFTSPVTLSLNRIVPKVVNRLMRNPYSLANSGEVANSESSVEPDGLIEERRHSIEEIIEEVLGPIDDGRLLKVIRGRYGFDGEPLVYREICELIGMKDRASAKFQEDRALRILRREFEKRGIGID